MVIGGEGVGCRHAPAGVMVRRWDRERERELWAMFELCLH